MVPENWLSRTLSESSSISELPVLLDWLRSFPLLFDVCYLAQLVTSNCCLDKVGRVRIH